MTGLSEHRSISAALLRIVTGAVIVLVLLACDNGQPDTLADNGEVMLTLRISLPTATDGSTATRAITSNEENAIDIAQLKVLVFKASGSTETFSYEAPQVQLLGGKYMVTLKQSLAGEKYRLAVIANAGKKLPVIPDNTPKSDVLKMITFDAAGIWNATGTTSIIRKTKCFDFWERNVLFPKTKRSFFRTPKHPLPCPFPLNFSLLIITKKFGNLAKNRYICIV